MNNYAAPPPPPTPTPTPTPQPLQRLPRFPSSIALLHIAFVVLAFIGFALASVHSLIRLFRSSSSAAPSSSVSIASSAPSSPNELNHVLINSLPVFNLSSPLAALAKSSPECAVCLRPFNTDEDLRLLPACFHAFHSNCVEHWIRTSPSCPLCRALVTLPAAPLPSLTLPSGSRSGSLCVEISSTNQAEGEALVDSLQGRVGSISSASGAAPPEEVAEVANGRLLPTVGKLHGSRAGDGSNGREGNRSLCLEESERGLEDGNCNSVKFPRQQEESIVIVNSHPRSI